MSFRRILMRMGKRIRRVIATMKRETKRLIIVATATFLVGTFLGGKISGSIEKQKADEELTRVTKELKEEGQSKVEDLQEELDEALNEEETKLPWYLVLVNNKNPMEEGYVPELTELEPDYSVDSRIADAAKKMLKDAKKAGMQIVICSAYRSVERQEQVFNDSLKDRLNQGMSYWDAFADNRLSVAEPGTSEHALGLALDLISNQYTELDKGQEDTKEAKWLKENCHKYGFILRYPPEKTDITGIIYEPWHYRYVGVEHAARIMESGLTLEEYLEEYY